MFGLLSAPLMANDKSEEDQRLAGFDADIAEIAQSYNAPGLAVAIIEDGEIVHTTFLGSRDLETGARVDERTQFGIGSVVKSFTSGLIGQLAGEGMTSLDAHPRDVLTQFPVIEGFDDGRLKLSQLLTQTSGLPFMDGSLGFFPPENRTDIVARLTHFTASCEPADCWRYNNLNFALLDTLAQEATGQSKSELFEARLLGPAGMSNSLATTQEFRVSATAAKGYVMVDGTARATALENFYSEHVYATAPDLARWAALWMNEGRVGEVQVLPSDYVVRAMSMQAIDNGAPPSPSDPGSYLFGYGHAWFVKSVDGEYVVHHGGNENGFSTHVLFLPARGIGVVALTNQQNSILPNLVTDAAMRRMAGLAVTPISDYPVVVRNGQALLPSEQTAVGWNDEDPLDFPAKALAGDYYASGYGLMSVRAKGDRLELETPLASMTLLHVGARTFRLATHKPLPAGINLDFFRLEFGENAQNVSFNIAAEPVVFEKR